MKVQNGDIEMSLWYVTVCLSDKQAHGPARTHK